MYQRKLINIQNPLSFTEKQIYKKTHLKLQMLPFASPCLPDNIILISEASNKNPQSCERGLVVRALDLQAGGPVFRSSFLPLDGFAFGGPEINSCTLCKQPTGSPPASWDSYHVMLICSFIFVCNAHLNIFTWNLRDINVYFYYYFFFPCSLLYHNLRV